MMRRRTVLGLGMAGLSAGVAWPAWACGLDEIDTALHQLAAARAQERLPGLTPQPALTAMSRHQVQHMAASSATTHLDAQNRDPVARAQQAGYGGRVLGEALAETWDGPAETVTLWLGHDPTRDVLLDPAARDLGLSLHRGDDGRMWWDLVVGA
jgi:uncharacterized protein YkwD